MDRRKFLLGSGAALSLAGLAPSFGISASNVLSPVLPNEFSDRIKPIPAEERSHRVEQAQKYMHDYGLDAVFMEGGTSLNYFTGASWGRSERLFGVLLFAKGDPVFIAPKFEEGRAKEQTGNASLYTWEEHESPFELIQKILKEKNLLTGKLGLEETTRYFVTDNIGKAAPALTIQSATPVIAGCRARKSEKEIALMQVANDMTAKVFASALGKLKEGMTENEFGKIITSEFAAYGVGGGALVLFGEASAYPHGLVKEHKLKEGDIVLIDGGCTVEGYDSDVTRTSVFGKPSEKMKKVWEIVRKAQDAALKTAKPGIPAELVDTAARKVIGDNGFDYGYKYFTHRLGHGIGMDGHEWYYLVGGNKRALEVNNIFSNEPGVYIPGEFGIRLEDEMLITADGARLLLPQAQSLEKIF